MSKEKQDRQAMRPHVVKFDEPWEVGSERESYSKAIGASILLVGIMNLVAGAIWMFASEQKPPKGIFLGLFVFGIVCSIFGFILTYRVMRFTTILFAPKVTESDYRAYEAESEVLLRALEVFGDSARALEWMRQNNLALHNKTPLRAIQTKDGRQEVVNVLGRIEHGVIS